MAQARRDPLFWAALDVANNDIPGVGDCCLRWHVTKACLEDRISNTSPDGCSMQGKLDELGKDFDGAECHLCHRMMENPSPPSGELYVYNENAQFWLDDTDCGGHPDPPEFHRLTAPSFFVST